MSNEPHFKMETHEDMMKFVNMDEHGNGSELDLSEDGASSVASSADLHFDGVDNYDFNNNAFQGDDFNWMSADGTLDDGVYDARLGLTMPDGLHSASVSQSASSMNTFDLSQELSGTAIGHSTASPGFIGYGSGSEAHEMLQRISFGASDENIEEYSAPEHEKSLSLYSFSPAEESALEYDVDVDDFPARSRVETQIKCRLTFRRKHTKETPHETLLHLPADTIARPRFQLANPEQLLDDQRVKSQTLWLSVDAVNPDVPDELILMCPKCLARERRRAFRKKAMDPHEETYWNKLQVRRIIIFNCREVVPINSDGQVELPLRIACYCRHHAAKNGYRLVFGLRDHTGRLLGRAISTSVFITDSHKDQRKASAHSLVSPVPSIPTTPSSVSSQESLPLASAPSHIRRASSQSSMNMHPQQGTLQSQSQQHHHPYMRPKTHSQQQMPVAGMQLPSSQLSRQIQLSQAVPSWIAGVQTNDQMVQHQAPAGPTIFRVIPPTGSVRGGVEVTLLGQNFRQGMVAMFGDAQSVHTQCWSESTIIAQLPPSNQPGPVPVTFQGEPEPANGAPATFTYVNDGEDKLKEIALQMIGYKMTGKIEDAGDIAQRIVVNDDHRESSGTAGANGNGENLTHSAEQLALWVLHNLNKIGPNRLPNVNLRNSEGQSMLHLASMLGYASVVKALISSGAYIDIQDVSGLTSLHFAVLFGNRNVTRLLLMADADPFHRTLNGLTALDLTDVTVEDLLPKDQRAWFSELNRRGSSSSIASMIQEWRTEVPNFAGFMTPELTDEMSEAASVDYSETSDLSEAEEEAELRKPPSYSKLFPGGEEINSVHEIASPYSAKGGASLRLRRSNQKFRRSSRETRRHASTHSAPVIDIEVMSSDDENEADDDAAEGDNYETQGSLKPGWKWNPKLNQDIWNDKMLFTFWIPLSLLTIVGILTIYVIQSYGKTDAHPLARKLGDFVAKFCSGAMDRMLPMPRWNQAVNRAPRTAS